MIRVREVLTLAAKELGREDLCQSIDSTNAATNSEVVALVHCFNMVENEIALDYFPLKTKQTFSGASGVVSYQNFTRSPVYIYSVCSEAGTELSYELRADGVALSAPTPSAVITYSYSPQTKSLTANSDFQSKISPRLMAYGVACEYCLTLGKFQEAALWESKYKDALRAANLLRRKLRVRSRRWV